MGQAVQGTRNRIKQMKRKRPYISLFIKTVFAFIVIGIFPLFFMGISVYHSYSDNIKGTMLSNLSQMTLYVGKSINDVFQEMETNTQYLYKYGITDYDYFYELVLDEEITETRRSAQISDALKSILYLNQYIDHVMFITPDGNYYSSMRPPEIMVNRNALLQWHEKNKVTGRDTSVIPTHITDYFFYSSVLDFTVARNIMNTKTILQADKEVLGTLYIDVNMKILNDIIREVNFGEKHEIYIADREKGVFVYNKHDFEAGRDVEDLSPWLSQMSRDGQYIKTQDSYLIYSFVPDSDWVVIDKVPSEVVESSYKQIRNNMMMILGSGILLLIGIYWIYSKVVNKPILELKRAMSEIQRGNLDIRVDDSSNDEIGTLAAGLNQMAENLQIHIKKVYVAEINQREAKLEALKTQIQPHYLYNTLDVIRMTAITNDDEITAAMLDSLSAQLRYLIGTTRDMVTLRAEADSIRNYFKLIEVRFDNRFELEIDIPEELLELSVPQLILQPAVENAIKHGLRPKSGEGKIAIYAKEEKGNLEITVMDNGIGMNEENLKNLQDSLDDPEFGRRTDNTWESIGIKNVYNRIKLIYGDEYGLMIDSYEEIGTIVKYMLPILSGEKEDVQNFVG